MLSKGKAVNRVYFAYDYRETDDYPPPTFWNNGEFAWGDSIPVELQRPYFAWDGDSADIVRYIDEGAFYVLYQGGMVRILLGYNLILQEIISSHSLMATVCRLFLVSIARQAASKKTIVLRRRSCRSGTGEP